MVNSETYFDELKAYKQRLYKRIDLEAHKYGYTFEQVESAYRLPANKKQEIAEQSLAYYRELQRLTQERLSPKEISQRTFLLKPALPDPADFSEYLEYARIDELLNRASTNGKERL